MQVWEGSAPAKINLSLKVLGKRADGYHELDSLVAFADIADQLRIEKVAGEPLIERLHVDGPFRSGVHGENIILTALSKIEDQLGHPFNIQIYLMKNLPIASGIGGGSSDAAAFLRGMAALFDIPSHIIHSVGRALGADVPVCLSAQPCWMGGIGHDVTHVDALPECDVILVNPQRPVHTADIFARLKAGSVHEKTDHARPSFVSTEQLFQFVLQAGNDLTPHAVAVCPEISVIIQSLIAAGAPCAAMSGSGATCFALAPRGDSKEILARLDLPSDFWIRSGSLIGATDTKIDQIKE